MRAGNTHHFLSAVFIFNTVALNIGNLAAAELPTSSIEVVLGPKSLQESDWGAASKQVQLGIQADLGTRDSVVNLVIGGFYSSQDTHDSIGAVVRGRTRELDLGVRKLFLLANGVNSFAEGGVNYINAKIRKGFAEDSNNALGYWAGVGAKLAVGEFLMVNVGVRYSTAEVTLNNKKLDAGGISIGIGVGLGF